MSWTLRSSGFDGVHIFDGLSVWSQTLGLFVVVNADFSLGYVATSPDGATWTLQGNPFASGNPEGTFGVLALNDAAPLFATAAGRGYVYTSPDAITWTQHSTPLVALSDDVGGICYSPDLNLWVAGDADGDTVMVMTSPDAATWTAQTSPWDSAGGSVQGITWSPTLGLFLAVGFYFGGVNECFMTSPDGVTWSSRSSPFDNGEVYQAIWSQTHSMFVAGGFSGGGNNTIVTSPDGVTWTVVPNDPFAPPAEPSFGECNALIEVGTTIYVAGSDSGGPTIFGTADLSTWTDTGCPLSTDAFSLAYSPSLGILLATGNV